MNGEKKHKILPDYIKYSQMNGQYVFTKSQALDYLQCSKAAFAQAVSRAQKKTLLVQPKSGFFVIVPIEYYRHGSPPASWFIDALMSYLGEEYYVGLLSAASLYGAAHQQPQVFQVVTSKQIPTISVGRNYIKFIYKKTWPNHWTIKNKRILVICRFQLLRQLH